MKVTITHDSTIKGYEAYCNIHGTKGLNYSARDTKKGRKEAERLFLVRSGMKPESIEFIHK